MASSNSPLSSPSDSGYDSVLDSTDAAELEQLGLVTAPKNGKRKVQPSTSSDSSEWSLPSSAPSVTDSDIALEIPEFMHSQETFQFLGLNPTTAEMLWQRWIEIPFAERGPDGHISFLSMAEYQVNAEEEDCHTRTDDWEAFIMKVGFAQETAFAIIDRGFDLIRYTESAKYWLLDTLGLRWRALEEIQERSRLRLRIRQDKSKSRGGVSRGVNLRGGAGEPSIDPDHIPGSTVLWHGSDMRWLKKVIDPITGKFHLDDMQATWPSDFRGIQGTGAVLYFSPQKAVGETYARYARRRSQSSTVRNVRMEVPNSLLQKYKPVLVQHHNSDMWKRVIWESRRRRRIPKPYAYLNSAELLIGPICHSKDSAIVNLESWEEISESKHMLTVEEEWWNEKTEEYETKTRHGIQIPNVLIVKNAYPSRSQSRVWAPGHLKVIEEDGQVTRFTLIEDDEDETHFQSDIPGQISDASKTFNDAQAEAYKDAFDHKRRANVSVETFVKDEIAELARSFEDND